ncbi:MAG TPA: CYTH domain-containing protein, partial [Dehalococcoidales bacterium]|nr:CYTH domain-containing protein [Dehalococcoidales bacterium]
MTDASGSIEVELKFILPGRQSENTVIGFLRRNKYRVTKIGPLENIDIYMDTSDWSLLRNKLSLRYRVSDGRAMYTMKSVGEIQDGIAKRTENEIGLEAPPQSPTEIPIKSLRKQVDEIIFPRKLLEQILIRTYRRRYMALTPEKARIELDFDASSFAADALFKPKRAPRLYQFEAEVIKGPETAL